MTLSYDFLDVVDGHTVPLLFLLIDSSEGAFDSDSESDHELVVPLVWRTSWIRSDGLLAFQVVPVFD
jgi:hypothetical protein